MFSTSFLFPEPIKPASAIAEAINSIDLIASSFPGIKYSTPSGFTFESANPITGIPSFTASVIAVVSLAKSTTKIASGSLLRFTIPPIYFFSFSISRLIFNLSDFVYAFISPEDSRETNSLRYTTLLIIVLKFVSIPPSHLKLT